MEPTIKLLPSGYWHVRWNRENWAQWPKGTEPVIQSVFHPPGRFAKWWESGGREQIQELELDTQAYEEANDARA